MLGTWLFVAFWALLGLGVFYFAIRGGAGGVQHPARARSYRIRGAGSAIFVIVYIGFGVGLPLAFLIGNHANANGQVGGYTLTAAEKQGRELFGRHCAVCHTLAAANAIAKVGPNLDVIKPSASLVLHTIENGCLQSPPSGDTAQSCLGEGNMPQAIVQGQQATDVAQFVAQVAGRE